MEKDTAVPDASVLAVLRARERDSLATTDDLEYHCPDQHWANRNRVPAAERDRLAAGHDD